jgi:hypothetical protein
VAGICLLQHPRIYQQELLDRNNLLLQFACKFVELYYQWKELWIHFVCQSIHLLTHIASETVQVGPLAYYAQWTLETATSNLGQEI